MTDREVMRQALLALEGWDNYGKWAWPDTALEQSKRNTTESLASLRAALEQPERQPLTDEQYNAIQTRLERGRTMTKDDIIRMAREAGIEDAHFVTPHPGVINQLERFAKLVAAAEREECAKVCLDTEPFYGIMFANAIIARGNT